MKIELTINQINTILTALGVRKMEKETILNRCIANNRPALEIEGARKGYWDIDEAEKAILTSLYN